MFQRVRKQINPATILALTALVFALTGGAFAATDGGSGSPAKATASVTHAATAKKKPAPKSTRGPAGPKGATGATGATGAMGAIGATGPGGPQGNAGSNGNNGEPGKNGENGKPGKPGENGKEGEPWTPNNTLPSKATETGTWSYSLPEVYSCVEAPEEEVENTVTHVKEKVHTGKWEDSACTTEAPENPAYGRPVGDFERQVLKLGAVLGGRTVPIAAQISFTIPLAAPMSDKGCEETKAPCQVHYLKFEEQTTECPGSVEAPKAAPDNLCVYEAEAAGTEQELIASPTERPDNFPEGPHPEKEFVETGTSGALVFLKLTPGTPRAYVAGSWAVTAE
jgi:hypothetical protein